MPLMLILMLILTNWQKSRSAEAIIQSHDGHNLDNQLERAAEALRLPDWDAKIEHLSGGERRRGLSVVYC